MDEIAQAKSQLNDVEELLKVSPEDESLLSLKSDLLDLIKITKEAVETVEDTTEKNSESHGSATAPLPASTDYSGIADVESVKRPSAEDSEKSTEPPKKKKRKLKDFEVPQHLLPKETDNDAEKNRKRRAIKALKSKYREEKKEREANQKQKSWQSFQKKKGSGKSIFATTSSKVGVSGSGLHMTEFGERKRHK